ESDPVVANNTSTSTPVPVNVIDAVNDTPVTATATVPSGTSNTVVGTVLGNDTINGNPVTTTNTNVTPVSNGPLSVDANGGVTLAANTPSGTYTVTYQLCESDPVTGLNVSPSNCDTAIATVVVSNVIDAVNDTPVTATATVPSGTSNTVVGTVLGNDTINGNPVTTTNTNVTPVSNGPLSVDANGGVTLAANTPSGTYTVTYQLCESDPVTGLNVSPSNCDTAIATVVVSNVIDAVNDGPITIIVTTTGPISGGSVLGNDTLNGVLASIVNTDVTPVTVGPLSIDVNGNVTIAPNTLAGTYSITYQLCETGAVPANCDTAIATYIIITDSDGDGVTDVIEIADGTDPNDFCDFLAINVTLPQSQVFLDADCDNDGLNNGDEYGDNPKDPLDSDGDGIPDFLEFNNHTPSEDDLEIFNLVTPNDDGDNDVFVIRNIELYPNNTVEIYNRWGLLVYETKGYGQNGKYFKGYSEGRVTLSQNSGLPVGTYFYIVKYINNNNQAKERSGYLYINR
ncbi:MAG: gliding motility-associated C-terminal domain-containing protein, partial [Flavobacterium sp.]|uniref:gliding motility-associated C-terminal domain-containing protein n=1 Tax=Flavobacterium sp. TaxID=239 RepID=UPI0032638A7E